MNVEKILRCLKFNQILGYFVILIEDSLHILMSWESCTTMVLQPKYKAEGHGRRQAEDSLKHSPLKSFEGICKALEAIANV